MGSSQVIQLANKFPALRNLKVEVGLYHEPVQSNPHNLAKIRFNIILPAEPTS